MHAHTRHAHVMASSIVGPANSHICQLHNATGCYIAMISHALLAVHVRSTNIINTAIAANIIRTVSNREQRIFQSTTIEKEFHHAC